MLDKQAILQVLIDSDRLNKYFHTDAIAQRIPLRIIKGTWYEEGIWLTKFGQPVQFIADKDANGTYLAVLELDIINNEATVKFRYTPEGIVGEARVEKEHMQWTVKSLTIHEQ